MRGTSTFAYPAAASLVAARPELLGVGLTDALELARAAA